MELEEEKEEGREGGGMDMSGDGRVPDRREHSALDHARVRVRARARFVLVLVLVGVSVSVELVLVLVLVLVRVLLLVLELIQSHTGHPFFLRSFFTHLFFAGMSFFRLCW